MNQMKSTYTIDDFIHAQIEERQYRTAHVDLQSYYTQRAQAFRRAFQMSLDERTFDGVRNAFRPLFHSALDSYVTVRTPFSNYIEMSQAMADIVNEFYESFYTPIQQMQAAHLVFLRTLLERWYGPLTRTVSSQELLEQGFDDARPGPDPLDYF